MTKDVKNLTIGIVVLVIVVVCVALIGKFTYGSYTALLNPFRSQQKGQSAVEVQSTKQGVQNTSPVVSKQEESKTSGQPVSCSNVNLQLFEQNNMVSLQGLIDMQRRNQSTFSVYIKSFSNGETIHLADYEQSIRLDNPQSYNFATAQFPMLDSWRDRLRVVLHLSRGNAVGNQSYICDQCLVEEGNCPALPASAYGEITAGGEAVRPSHSNVTSHELNYPGGSVIRSNVSFSRVNEGDTLRWIWGVDGHPNFYTPQLTLQSGVTSASSGIDPNNPVFNFSPGTRGTVSLEYNGQSIPWTLQFVVPQ